MRERRTYLNYKRCDGFKNLERPDYGTTILWTCTSFSFLFSPLSLLVVPSLFQFVFRSFSFCFFFIAHYLFDRRTSDQKICIEYYYT
ncbi:hypothetical protein F4810DRAFT_653450 [Camillea tinctor]|nr:hypothetical protein F4810DRAFT_653450 [Camillea tinctor]